MTIQTDDNDYGRSERESEWKEAAIMGMVVFAGLIFIILGLLGAGFIGITFGWVWGLVALAAFMSLFIFLVEGNIYS
jgi:hypothetical protein